MLHYSLLATENEIHVLSPSIRKEASNPLSDFIKFPFSKKYVDAKCNDSEGAEIFPSLSAVSQYKLILSLFHLIRNISFLQFVLQEAYLSGFLVALESVCLYCWKFATVEGLRGIQISVKLPIIQTEI